MERLLKNQGRYFGESINIDELQREVHRYAEETGWNCDTFLDRPGLTLRAYRRPCSEAKRNLYFSAGIHGDEPSGPLALLQLMKGNNWPRANLWVVPCLNPTGLRLNTRENEQGIDLNRDYRHRKSLEVSAHIHWLERQPDFDLTLLLHEDWEATGFYLYELSEGPAPSFGEAIIAAVREQCPIETSELVDNFMCRAGIIRPQFRPEDRPQWAEAVYLIANKSRLNYTLETPSDYPLPLRTQAQLCAVKRVFKELSA
jgi:murein peptide amidase A